MNRRSFIQRIASFAGLSFAPAIPVAAVPVEEPSDFPDVDITSYARTRMVNDIWDEKLSRSADHE